MGNPPPLFAVGVITICAIALILTLLELNRVSNESSYATDVSDRIQTDFDKFTRVDVVDDIINLMLHDNNKKTRKKFDKDEILKKFESVVTQKSSHS